MKVYQFNKEKYKNGILMDLGDSRDIPQFNFSDEPHCATFYEIIIIRKGKGIIFLDDKKIDFKEGAFIFISPNQKRRWQLSDAKIEVNFIIFEQSFLNDFFSDKFFVYRLHYFYSKQITPYFFPSKRLFSFENDVFKEIQMELKNYQKDSAHLLRSILYYILVKLNRYFCEFHLINSTMHENELAIQFKELLQKNIRKFQTINEYCQVLNISRISLNASVKKQFGMTATDFLHAHLLYEIKDQILFTNKTMAEIAFEFNFKEPQHLNRFFKRLTHQTPLEFRVAYQNGYTN